MQENMTGTNDSSNRRLGERRATTFHYFRDAPRVRVNEKTALAMTAQNRGGPLPARPQSEATPRRLMAVSRLVAGAANRRSEQ